MSLTGRSIETSVMKRVAGLPVKPCNPLKGRNGPIMIRAFNKHYRKAIEIVEESSASEKMDIAERVLEWFHQLPEEYVISLALFFNEVIDDLGDETLEKFNFHVKRKKKNHQEEDEEDEDELEEDNDYEDDDEDY
jgi:hypothetical protein